MHEMKRLEWLAIQIAWSMCASDLNSTLAVGSEEARHHMAHNSTEAIKP